MARPPTVASVMRDMQRRTVPRNRHLPQEFGVRGASSSGARLGMDQMVSSGIGEYGGGAGGGEMVLGDEEALAPFDVLLMRGTCVVNEAMLTGESVPQAKTSLLSAGGSSGGGGGGGEEDGGPWIKLGDGTDSPHRKHVIFSGTKV